MEKTLMDFNDPAITLQADLLPPSSRRVEDVEEGSYGRSRTETLRTYAIAAIATLIDRRDAASNESFEIQFLLNHLEAVNTMGPGWAEAIAIYLDQPDPSDAPLIRLARELGLRLVEILTVTLAAAVEDDVMIGRALAHLQAPLGGSRPTLGLLSAAFLNARIVTENPINTLLTGVAIQSGLLTVIGDSAPMPERAAGVPLPLCLALKGQDAAWPGTTIGLGVIPDVTLSASIAEEAERQTRGLFSSPQRALVLRTGSTAEGRSVASRIAQHLRRRALFIETDKTSSLGPWLILRELLPVFCLDLAPGERKTLPSLPYYQGPVLALCGPDGSVEAQGGTALSWSLPVPPIEERQQLWEAVLGEGDLAADLARHHRHGSGRIAHLGRIIRHRIALNDDSPPTREDIAAASWITEGASLDALAQPLPDAIPDEALVMTATLRNEMETLMLRCRARDTLTRDLGVSATARYKPGVRALFVGPSGTGKTLAAGWLATRLGLPLYRVDLASVTSKYIGETEKNLAQLLARAEQAEVVLLFDEADSLFGKRTDVKDANDRFANAQTNYLLQRIEYFDGITLLTSNSRNRFDSAFSRRLDMIIDFPAPGPEERRLLWQSHLGANHHLTQRDLNQLAATADLSGGHIRNAVLTAAVFAQTEGRLIKYDDIIHALTGEYRKLGRQMPVGLKTNA
jgi:hypothetical protein